MISEMRKRISWTRLLLRNYKLVEPVSKRCQFYFFHNSTKHWPILISFDNVTQKLDVNDCSSTHLTLILLLHYLVKCSALHFTTADWSFAQWAFCRLWKLSNSIRCFCVTSTCGSTIFWRCPLTSPRSSPGVSPRCASYAVYVGRCRVMLSLVYIVVALVLSRLDYCNGVLAGLPASQLNRLQAVLHRTTHLRGPLTRSRQATATTTTLQVVRSWAHEVQTVCLGAVRRWLEGRRRRLVVLRPAVATRWAIFIGGGGVSNQLTFATRLNWKWLHREWAAPGSSR